MYKEGNHKDLVCMRGKEESDDQCVSCTIVNMDKWGFFNQVWFLILGTLDFRLEAKFDGKFF